MSTKAVDKRPESVSTTCKQQIDDNNIEPQPKRAPLTRKNLSTLDKMNKKKTSDPTDPTDYSRSSKTTSTTMSGFAIKARKNGILDPRSCKPPTNLEDLRKRHTKERANPSPSESAYEDYIRRVEKANNEQALVVKTSEKLLNEYQDEGYNQNYNRQFTGLPNNAGFNDGLSAPQPDYIEGLDMVEYLPFPVDEYVPGATLYRDDPRSLVLPHFAGEYKGRNGNMEVARTQSAYDGAALVYGRNQALAYMGKSDPPGHAEITTFTTNGTTLDLYAHYATPSAEDEDKLEYHQYLISTTNIKDTYQGHKDGIKGLRNAQDYAKQQSYAMRDELKKHWKQHCGKLLTYRNTATNS